MPVPEALVEIPHEAKDAQVEYRAGQPSIDLEYRSQVIGTSEILTEPTDNQIYKYTHSNGNEFAGTLIEATKLCPVIGRMSIANALATLQDADLASRVAQRGRERRESETSDRAESRGGSEKQTEVSDPKLQKVQTEGAAPVDEALVVRIIEPKIDEINKVAVSELKVTDLHDPFIHQAEAVRFVQDNASEFEEANTVPIEKAKSAEGQKSIPTINNRPVVAEVTRVSSPNEANYRATVSKKFPVYQRDQSRSEIPLSFPHIIERKVVEVESTVAAAVLPPTYETTPKLDPFIAVTDRKGEDMPELATLEVLKNSLFNELTSNYNLLQSERDQSVSDISEATHYELRNEVEVFSYIFKAPLFVQEKIAETTETETHQSYIIPELPSPIVEIESTLEQLVEVIEKDRIDDQGKIEVILQKIIALPAKAELSADNSIELPEVNLEVLFIELFEEANIPYTPEIIESFVKLTKAHYLKDLLEFTKESDDEALGLPDEIGTREFLQKLQQGLSTMKQAVIYFYELGKSVLRMYSFSAKAAA